MSERVRVRGNDWGVLVPPQPGTWLPTRTVSVVIPAYQCQQFVDLALAALARQTYPDRLLEVVVADDGSDPPIALPDLAPTHTRVVRVPDHSTGWGRANALHVGATVSDGDILHWLDADIVPFPGHVEAQARWHHVADEAVTLGYKRFVPDGPWPTPEQVTGQPVEALFPDERTARHDYVEELIGATDGLRRADHLAFRAHVGATAALPRELYRQAGGLRTDLRLGEDSELGYRLAQAGAVFVPEPAADSWHLGPSNMMRDGEALRRYNRPYLADAMPHPRWLRGNAPGRSWRVPLVTAVVTATGPAEQVRRCVDRLLASDEHDLRVLLAGDWQTLTDDRRRVLDDPLLDLRLLAATYQGDPRVRLVARAPESAFPSPYLLRVPPEIGVGPRTVRQLLADADEHRAGLLRVLPPAAGSGAALPVVELWRTAAVSRARRVRRAGESLPEVVDAVWGARWLSGRQVGVVDLATAPAGAADPSGAPTPPPVPVAGVRSLLRATGHVGWLAAGRAGRRLDARQRALRRRVRLRTRLRRAREAWRETFPRALPPWPHPPGPPTTGTGQAEPAVDASGAPVVDARAANPQGRQRYGPRLPAGQLGFTGDGGWAVTRVPDGTTVVAGRAGRPLDDRQRAVLRELGLITPAAGDRPVPGGAAVLAQLAMTGVVLHVPPAACPRMGVQSKGAPTTMPVAGELAEILTAPLPDGDPMQWEMRSVRQRRAAMRQHAAGLAHGGPAVTAVLVSKRPQLVLRQVAALAAQTYPDLQLVVGLHGGAEPPGLREAAGGRPLEVVHIPTERNLGEALAAASRVAEGELVTKVDDDDRYGPDHVWDLVLAHHFSGATAVGKGSEFVFVAPRDVTVRRRMGAEFFTDTVAGGTITLRRDDLAAAGGWPPVPRHVDRALLDRVSGRGGTVYRTHPIGFVYTRHGDGHTWNAEVEHFLQDARRSWRGALSYEEFGTA